MSDYVHFCQVAETVKKRPSVSVVILLCMLLTQVFFYYYPLRGFVIERRLSLPQISSSMLVDFKDIWVRLVNDDQFMLELVESTFQEQSADHVQRLRLVQNLRTRLNYSFLSPNIVEIAYTQSNSYNMQPIINEFVSRIQKNINRHSQHVIERRHSALKLRISTLLDELLLLSRVFDVDQSQMIIDKLTEHEYESEIFKKTENDSFFQTVGMLMMNYKRYELYSNLVNEQLFLRDDLKLFELYPKQADILTDVHSPPGYVQAYYQLFYVLIFVAYLLIWLAVVTFIAQLDNFNVPTQQN